MELGGHMITLDEARKTLTDLLGMDTGPMAGFLVVIATPQDGYLVAGSITCLACRSGFLAEAITRIQADGPHELAEHWVPVSLDEAEKRDARDD